MLTVLNDLHLGAIRSSGTTPQSALQLRRYLLKAYDALMDGIHTDVVILGDWLDTYNIPMSDLLDVYQITSAWLGRGHKLWLVNGNHDLSKSSENLSSMEFLCRLLTSQFPTCIHVDKPLMTEHGYMIPHLPNQQEFDDALAAVPPCDVVFTHCNVSNEFAKHSDHSLNMTIPQLTKLPCKHVVNAHEHQQRKIGKCWIPGNQVPSSVADCLGAKTKGFIVIKNGTPSFETVAPITDWYVEQDWRRATDTDHLFVRLTGKATSEEAVQVASAVAEYRKVSSALVVSNAVDIETVEDTSISQSLEHIKAFDVMGALREILTPEDIQILESLK